MKRNLLLTFVLLFTFTIYSQEDSLKLPTLSAVNFSNIYVLDSGYQLRLPYTWVNADNRVNFLMVSNGKVVITSSMRRVGKMMNHQFFGEVDGFEITNNKDGQKVIEFYARAREFRIGQVRSFEITILPNDLFLIHFFDKLGKEEFFFHARFPTKEEEKEIELLFQSF